MTGGRAHDYLSNDMTYPTRVIEKLNKLNTEVHGTTFALGDKETTMTETYRRPVPKAGEDVTCPFCVRPLQHRRGLLVRHGWREVGGGTGFGRGWHQGQCPGVGDVCLDVSDVDAQKHVKTWQGRIEDLEAHIRDVEANKIPTYTGKVPVYHNRYTGGDKAEFLKAAEAGYPVIKTAKDAGVKITAMVTRR